jgi:hypothetical protein
MHNPILTLTGMSSSGPGHQDQETAMSGSLKGLVTDDSRVIARPSSYHRVDGLDQFGLPYVGAPVGHFPQSLEMPL